MCSRHAAFAMRLLRCAALVALPTVDALYKWAFDAKNISAPRDRGCTAHAREVTLSSQLSNPRRDRFIAHHAAGPADLGLVPLVVRADAIAIHLHGIGKPGETARQHRF